MGCQFPSYPVSQNAVPRPEVDESLISKYVGASNTLHRQIKHTAEADHVIPDGHLPVTLVRQPEHIGAEGVFERCLYCD